MNPVVAMSLVQFLGQGRKKCRRLGVDKTEVEREVKRVRWCAMKSAAAASSAGKRSTTSKARAVRPHLSSQSACPLQVWLLAAVR